MTNYRKQPMRLFLALFILLLVSGCGNEPMPPQNGRPPPAFTLENFSGGAARFPEDYRGKVVAIRFWASWCPFCAIEMAAIEPVYQKYREQGLYILAVNVEQSRGVVEDMVTTLRITYDALMDTDGAVAKSYFVDGLPITFFIDRNGSLRNKIVGEATPEMFEGIVQELLGES